MLGKLTSGPIFNARTVSLCSQIFAEAVKRTHRIGIFNRCARLIQTPLVSGSGLVLSSNFSLLWACMRVKLNFGENLPITTLVPSSIKAVAAFTHFSRCFNVLLQAHTGRATCAFMRHHEHLPSSECLDLHEHSRAVASASNNMTTSQLRGYRKIERYRE